MGIGYGGNKQAPIPFIIQAQEIMLKNLNERYILSAFARDLARLYLPNLRNIPEYYHPLDTDIAFTPFKIIASPLIKQLTWIFFAANGQVEGKRILDLGCGSTGSTEESSEHYDLGLSLYHPWLCRTLDRLGAYPIGVDIGELQHEKFETHRVNLLTPNALGDIPDGTIDIVHSRALFDSPELYEQFQKHLPTPWLSMDKRDNYLMELLQPQVMRVLKPSGVFVYSRHIL